jgi:hypothetical protein
MFVWQGRFHSASPTILQGSDDRGDHVGNLKMNRAVGCRINLAQAGPPDGTDIIPDIGVGHVAFKKGLSQPSCRTVQSVSP